jgi:hypothetical protein
MDQEEDQDQEEEDKEENEDEEQNDAPDVGARACSCALLMPGPSVCACIRVCAG